MLSHSKSACHVPWTLVVISKEPMFKQYQTIEHNLISSNTKMLLRSIAGYLLLILLFYSDLGPIFATQCAHQEPYQSIVPGESPSTSTATTTATAAVMFSGHHH